MKNFLLRQKNLIRPKTISSLEKKDKPLPTEAIREKFKNAQSKNVRPITPNRTTLKLRLSRRCHTPACHYSRYEFLTVSTVTVDTKGFRKPCIKFEFASNIVTTAAVLTLTCRFSSSVKIACSYPSRTSLDILTFSSSNSQ